MGLVAEGYVATYLNCFKCGGEFQQTRPGTKYIDFNCTRCKLPWQLKVSTGTHYFGANYVTVPHTSAGINKRRSGEDGFDEVAGYICLHLVFCKRKYSYRINPRKSYAVYPKINLTPGESVYEQSEGGGYMGKDLLTFVNVERKTVKCAEFLI